MDPSRVVSVNELRAAISKDPHVSFSKIFSLKEAPGNRENN